MQLPELFRRGVVVACDDDTELQLQTYGDIRGPISVRQVSFVNQDSFDELHSTGLLDQLNQAFDTLIGDYEEDELHPEQLDTAIRIVDEVIRSRSISKDHVIHRLRELMEFARTGGRRVFFVL